MTSSNHLPPLVLMSRDYAQNTFYSTMTDRQLLQQWAENGTDWRTYAFAEPLPAHQPEEAEKAIFGKTLAVASKHNALVFHLAGDDVSGREQLTTLCQLYDLFLKRTIPNPRLIAQWQARFLETGILPYGQPYKRHSSYHALTFALVPFLRSAMQTSRESVKKH